MPCRALVTLAALTWVLSSKAAAQPEPADPDIVVQAEREPATGREVTEQARNISVIGSPLDNPLPRFEDRICPGVQGLEADDAAYIIQRIRYNAEEFEVPLAKDNGKCEPNFIIAFVEDAQGQLAQLAKRQGYMLAGLSIDQRGELLDASGAARVWMNTVLRTNTGMPMPQRSSTNAAPERVLSYDPETGTAAKLGLPPEARGNASHSRISFPFREDIYSVLILFDRAQVRGKSLLQLADYATMRGFAFTRETRGEVPANTVLGLFDGDGPKPDELTAFDRGYLGSLYDGIPNLPATSKIGGVEKHMKRQERAAERGAE